MEQATQAEQGQAQQRAPEQGGADREAEPAILPQFAALAEARLGPEVFDHIAGAAGTEATMRRNALAFDSLAFRPRVLRDVSRISAAATLLGAPARLPVALAPIGSLHVIAPEAPAQALRAAGRFGIPAFVSSVAEPGAEALAAEGSGRKLFQLYIRGDIDVVADLLARVRGAGYQGIAVTVDSAHYGIRDRQRLGKWQPPAAKRGGKSHQARLTWEMLDEIVSAAAPLPVMLKGIQTAEDAEMALNRGIRTLYLSNHGGRQLDHCRATLDVLREVRAAVGPGPELLLDGGIRRGTDVLKALALGANGLGLGRLTAFGLAVGGEAGVVRMLEMLEEEVVNAMALLGVATLDQLTPDHVAAVPPLPPL